MTLSCPTCGRSTDIPEQLLSADGTQVNCPSCSTRFTALPSGFTVATPSEGSPDAAAASSPSGAGAPGASGEQPASPFLTTDGPSPGQQELRGANRAQGPGPALPHGTRLAGQYEVRAVLGRGRFATVYAAEDVHVGEPVALKVIPAASPASAEAAVRSLAAEYRATRDLDGVGRHHVLRIDRPQVAREENVDWVVLPMERAGGTLREWLDARPAAPGGGRPAEVINQGVELLRQVCQGLEALHVAGRAHLDVKPGNVLLFAREASGADNASAPTAAPSKEHKAEALAAEELIAKVGDFGLARGLRGEVLDASMSRAGIGTPTYMAPEQVFAARQKEVGAAADIYAFGVMLFELLDGDPPFDGSAESVRRKHREVAPPKVHTAEVPAHLEELAYWCLKKDPSERPASIAALREQLQADSGLLLQKIESATTAKEVALGNEAPEQAASEQAVSWAIPVDMPKLSDTMEEGVLVAWLADEGDQVSDGDIIAQVETDKATMDLEVFDDGVLLKKLVEEGDAVDIGGLIAIMGDEEADISSILKEFDTTEDTRVESDVDVTMPKMGETIKAQASEGAAEAAPSGGSDEHAGSDVAGRLYSALGVLAEEWSPYAEYLITWDGVDWSQVEVIADAAPEAARSVFEAGPTSALLRHATEADAAAVVALLLESGRDPNGADEAGSTLLHRASAANATKVAEVLLKAGADVQAQDATGASPLHRAAESGAREASALLLGAGADLKAQDDKDRTPLHGAVCNNAATVAEVLLAAGADLEAARGAFDQTPLHWAACNDAATVAEVLLAAGADLDARDKEDISPLHEAVRKDAVAVAEVLLEAGADPDARDRRGWTPLRTAATNDAVAVAEVLLAAGADPDARDRRGWMPLHGAVCNNAATVAELLLEAGADPDARRKDDWTPLHMAAHFDAYSVTKLLLEAGADPDARDKEDSTPLHEAAWKDAATVAELLLEAGADPNAKNAEGKNTIQLSIRHEPFSYAASPPSVIKVLLKAGADPNARDEDGWTPLHEAVRKDAGAVAEVLLAAGADPDARDARGWMPLHFAARNTVAELLLKAGADPNARDEDGWTPLQRAAAKDWVAVAGVLLAAGADPNVKNADGRTVLDMVGGSSWSKRWWSKAISAAGGKRSDDGEQ